MSRALYYRNKNITWTSPPGNTPEESFPGALQAAHIVSALHILANNKPKTSRLSYLHPVSLPICAAAVVYTPPCQDSGRVGGYVRGDKLSSVFAVCFLYKLNKYARAFIVCIRLRIQFAEKIYLAGVVDAESRKAGKKCLFFIKDRCTRYMGGSD